MTSNYILKLYDNTFKIKDWRKSDTTIKRVNVEINLRRERNTISRERTRATIYVMEVSFSHRKEAFSQTVTCPSHFDIFPQHSSCPRLSITYEHSPRLVTRKRYVDRLSLPAIARSVSFLLLTISEPPSPSDFSSRLQGRSLHVSMHHPQVQFRGQQSRYRTILGWKVSTLTGDGVAFFSGSVRPWKESNRREGTAATRPKRIAISKDTTRNATRAKCSLTGSYSKAIHGYS